MVNVAAAVGLQNVLKSNLGPHGTLKLLVGGAGQLKLTKDGLVLLKEMQIQHPTAAMIARTATAQDDITGDGTTSTVLLCGSLLQQADRYAREGLHPRLIVDGFELAREKTLEFLRSELSLVPEKSAAAIAAEASGVLHDRELLHRVALTSLRTKLDISLADLMSQAVVDSILCISALGDTGNDTSSSDIADGSEEHRSPLDLHRVEIMNMPHSSMTLPMGIVAEDSKSDTGTVSTVCRFINGIVMDHGGRHPNMPSELNNCHIMTCNVSLEYEKTEVQSGFFYSTADEREKLVESERKWLDERCRLVVDFKRRVCKDGETFVMINQKGIDPLSLDIFAKEGILCLRRAKRRNMERLTLACGGSPILSLEDLEESMLGYAGKVSEITYGDDKFTFVEDCKNPKSCTLLLQGPNQLVMDQMKDAVRDGLRAVKNAIEDEAVVPGGGAFEMAASMYLREKVIPTTKGKAKLGVEAFAEALLIVPKTLAENSGFDVQDVLLKLQEERAETGLPVGLNVQTGEPMLPAEEGVWDNVRVKRQSIYLSTVLASQLLLVDEVMRAGKQMGKAPPGPE